MAEPQESRGTARSVVSSCSATDCTFNENRECHAGEIRVEMGGQGAISITGVGAEFAPVTASLSFTASDMFALLRRLNEEGKTVLFVTHDRELAARAARVVEIRDGVVVGG